MNKSCEVKVFSSGDDFFNSETDFDAVFLDILMEGKNGMEIARDLREKGSDIAVIFVSVEEDFALEGYEVCAFDYILKPVMRERVKRILERLFKTAERTRTIAIMHNRYNVEIPMESIIYAEAEGHNINIYTVKGKFKAYMTFREFIKLFENERYFKICNRGIIVNLERVKKICDKAFIMEQDINVQISRSRMADMRAEYIKYIFEKTRGNKS